jgi:hypothetical protein
MGKTLMHGWMKREQSKTPVGSKVRCIERGVYYSDCEGIVIDHTQGKQTPCLRIQLTQTPKSKLTMEPCAEIIAEGQPTYWWSLIEPPSGTPVRRTTSQILILQDTNE